MAQAKQDDPPALPPGLTSTTYDRVYKALLTDIVNGTFGPGARLKIAELSARYGLSAIPVREALQQLQGEGIVVLSPNKGASVRPLDRKFVTDTHEVRGALYPLIYRDVVAGADPALDAALLRIQKRFDTLMRRRDLKGCRDQNHLFHATIQERCGNAEVLTLIRRYSNLTQSLRDVFGFDGERIKQISREHWAILDAVLARGRGRRRRRRPAPQRRGVGQHAEAFQVRRGIAMSDTERKLRRTGAVVGIRPDAVDEYCRVHAEIWPAVAAANRAKPG